MVCRHYDMQKYCNQFMCGTVVVFLQSYGWFIVLGLAVAFYFKGYIEQTLNRWRSSRQEETDYHRYGTVSYFSLYISVNVVSMAYRCCSYYTAVCRSQYNSINKYHTSGQLLLYQPATRINHQCKAFSITAPAVWNSLSPVSLLSPLLMHI